MSKIRFASEEYVDSKLTGAVTVQPNWAQNDAAASDYVKNRTHWVEGGSENIVVFEGELTDFNQMGIIYETGPFNTTAIDASKYKNITNCIVTHDGTVYTDCTTSFDDSGYQIEHSNPDFSFIVDSEGTAYYDERSMYNSPVYQTSLKVEITVSDETYHPLSENFIPDTIARKTDLEAAINAAIGNAIGGSY